MTNVHFRYLISLGQVYCSIQYKHRTEENKLRVIYLLRTKERKTSKQARERERHRFSRETAFSDCVVQSFHIKHSLAPDQYASIDRTDYWQEYYNEKFMSKNSHASATDFTTTTSSSLFINRNNRRRIKGKSAFRFYSCIVCIWSAKIPMSHMFLSLFLIEFSVNLNKTD